MRSLLFPPDQPTQCHRLRRTLLAFAFYALCALVTGFAMWQGMYPAFALGVFTVGFVTATAAFFLIIRLGWNRRFKDPSLTEAQIVCSIFLCSYTLIYAGQFRGVYMFAYVIGLMFGGNHVTARQLTRLALLPVILFPVVVFMVAREHPQTFDWRVEFVYWISLCVMMAFTSMLVGNLSSLRTRLKASNAELESAMQRLTVMAVRDDLTGLYNRRHLLDMLEREKSRTDRGADGTFSVCLLDIDHFKRINDTYGHGNGDTVLRSCAAVAEQCIRTADCVGRWGGEEFLLLLPQTPAELAEVCVERIQSKLLYTRFDGLPPDLRITVSAGIAQYRAGGTVKGLVEQADRALYRAKRAGRNRIVQADVDGVPAQA